MQDTVVCTGDPLFPIVLLSSRASKMATVNPFIDGLCYAQAQGAKCSGRKPLRSFNGSCQEMRVAVPNLHLLSPCLRLTTFLSHGRGSCLWRQPALQLPAWDAQKKVPCPDPPLTPALQPIPPAVLWIALSYTSPKTCSLSHLPCLLCLLPSLSSRSFSSAEKRA